MREALWLGDLNLAQELMEESVRINPWDAKTYLEMGEVLIRRGNFSAAAVAYTQAAHLSPPASGLLPLI